ncbi:g protein-coupled receptor [Anaeramoeba flamelloides]|uniref:G protein-coupled receptor n=1 Tax=Anaeramoeba flamelloides TaxID=1746091 RepID=A0ABQ8Y392_9EUKA|nr:g protein-coupled receptor [Anaeramoeba flamelloides]
MISLSSVSDLIIVISFIKFANLDKLHRKYLFTLTIYDLMSGIIDFLPGRSNSFFCDFQAIAQSFLSTIPPYWAATISLITYLRLVQRRSERSLKQMYKPLHLVIVIIALLFLVSSVLTDGGFRTQTYWCAPSDKTLIIIYTWYWVMIFTSLIFTLLTVKQIRKILRQSNEVWTNLSHLSRERKKKQLMIQLKMLVVPLVFIWCYVWPSIDRIIEISNKRVSKGLLLMYSINFELSAPIYCAVFVFGSSEIRESWKQYRRQRKFKKFNDEFKNNPNLNIQNRSERNQIFNIAEKDIDIGNQNYAQLTDQEELNPLLKN